MKSKIILSLNDEEVNLILSSLRADRVGTWRSDRGERIEKLTAKIKRVKPVKITTGFTKV